jgi:hypothetical protein
MKPVLGAYAFDEWEVAVRERHEFRDGRLRRVIALRGASDLFASAEDAERALDHAAGAVLSELPARLRLRPGRSIPVYFRAWQRERHHAATAGAFTLEVEALADWEEADAPTEQTLSVAGMGMAGMLTPEGSLRVPLTLRFTASGAVVIPGFGDGQRQLVFNGMVEDGETLTLDGEQRKTWLGGLDVSDQVQGDYLFIGPGATEISFQAEPDGACSGSLVCLWKNRWL